MTLTVSTYRMGFDYAISIFSISNNMWKDMNIRNDRVIDLWLIILSVTYVMTGSISKGFDRQTDKYTDLC